jgi:protein-S-isoprenylcysteine O-methyltransferase Ste14
MRRKLIPPSVFNAFLVLAVILHFVLPIKMVVHGPYKFLGLLLLFIGSGLNVWSTSHLSGEDTTSDFHVAPTALVVDGPFRISRNPIYLSGMLLTLGLAVLLGSLITFVFPVVMWLVLNQFHIPAEEKMLAQTFGEEYLEYKRQVRRWI